MVMVCTRVALCVIFLGAVATGCRSRTRAAGLQRRSPPGTAAIPPSSAAALGLDEHVARPLRRCFPEQPTWADAPVSDLLDHAGNLFDRDDFAGALACAEEAARGAPRSVEAHHDRAAALLHLGRLEEARDALALAMALDPDDAETLEASADLYINQLPPSADRSAIGLEQARRGFRHAAVRDRARAARLALLEGQALIDLGHAEQAIHRLDATLALSPRSAAARYEKGVAEFELCRFAAARRTFQKVVDGAADHAHALYHLGLIAEREGDMGAAQKYFADASRHDRASFPPPPDLSTSEFAAHVTRVVADLPIDVRHDLRESRLETADLPAADDLVAEKPPLSPTILGLFRGLPLSWSGDAQLHPQRGGGGGVGRVAKGRRPNNGPGVSPASVAGTEGTDVGAVCGPVERTIVLYRRNLLRSVRDIAALDEAIKRTLLHEVGHLRGEDDGSLRDRGLE
ncbi:MAG: tetratricopeptide repeat protein [Deltaproteobacteria bacterium]|nr:tetratricopeptide repeat protein [Deltaproteobacteria bacterium]